MQMSNDWFESLELEQMIAKMAIEVSTQKKDNTFEIQLILNYAETKISHFNSVSTENVKQVVQIFLHASKVWMIYSKSMLFAKTERCKLNSFKIKWFSYYTTRNTPCGGAGVEATLKG